MKYSPSNFALHKIEPVYEELEGWEDDISKIRTLTSFRSCKKYIKFIEEKCKINIS
jgi:adenylosuccinate synthase